MVSLTLNKGVPRCCVTLGDWTFISNWQCFGLQSPLRYLPLGCWWYSYYLQATGPFAPLCPATTTPVSLCTESSRWGVPSVAREDRKVLTEEMSPQWERWDHWITKSDADYFSKFLSLYTLRLQKRFVNSSHLSWNKESFICVLSHGISVFSMRL